ncbi:hypothetical protein BUALT_Bualt16G0086100 [Buddleja alternifolia]|uniref:RNase H type-1 domain-containing protein n=1 Tax=Buddleja alternifolia TaxID=168488 RepID=A0AAV6WA91_9LAMI|nr:hypothetical protein BUALT_Bualt16G0086100 [Buddleja alternifolia]
MNKGGGGGGPTAAAAAQKQKSLMQRVDADIGNLVDNFGFLVNVARVNDPPVRNSQESFMMEMRAARIWSLGSLTVNEAELLALREGLRIAWDRRLPRIVAEVDSEVLCNLIKNGDVEVHPLGNIIQDIRILLRNPCRSALQHTKREVSFINAIEVFQRLIEKNLMQRVDADLGNLVDNFGFLVNVARVNDPPVRNSQESFMMEMRAARMVQAAGSLLKLVSELKQTAIFSGFASLNDHVDQRIEEFDKLEENTNGKLSRIGEAAAASLKELESHYYSSSLRTTIPSEEPIE